MTSALDARPERRLHAREARRTILWTIRHTFCGDGFGPPGDCTIFCPVCKHNAFQKACTPQRHAMGAPLSRPQALQRVRKLQGCPCCWDSSSWGRRLWRWPGERVKLVFGMATALAHTKRPKVSETVAGVLLRIITCERKHALDA